MQQEIYTLLDVLLLILITMLTTNLAKLKAYS